MTAHLVMRINRDDRHDPATVGMDTVEPKRGLGSNFERAVLAALTFSTKSRIWGDKSPKAIEPTEPGYVGDGLWQRTQAKDGYRCMFCGFYSRRNQVHSLSDNHRDIRPENLRSADPLCHAWQHLGELGDGEAVIAYLPGLRGQDVNHLQRTIMVALHAEDAAVREDARKLLNWMASHRDYAKDAWGTYDPAVFADALVRVEKEEREKREVVFEDLAVVFNPAPYNDYLKTWAQESYALLPVGKWGQVYHDVMNAPA